MLRFLFYLNFVFVLIPTTVAFSQSSQQKYELIERVQLSKQAVSCNFFSFENSDKNLQAAVMNAKTMHWLNRDNSEFPVPEGYLKTIFSKTGKYFGFVSLKPNREDDEIRQIFIDVFSFEQGKRYSIKQSKHFDDSMPLVAISDADGSLILGQNFNGKIYFFSSKGELVKQVDLFPDAEYDLERTLSFDLDATGSKLAVAAGRRGASPMNSNAPNPSAEPHLYLFSSQGEKLWQKALPEFSTSSVRISDNGQYIVANCFTVDVRGNVKKRSVVFENEQEILSSDILFKKANFSKGSGYLVLADNTEARLFDLASKKVKWRAAIAPQEGMITAVEVNENADAAVLLVAKNEFKNGGFVFTQPYLRILNSAGESLQKITFHDQVFKKPMLRLSPASNQIAIGFLGNYQIYQVKQ